MYYPVAICSVFKYSKQSCPRMNSHTEYQWALGCKILKLDYIRDSYPLLNLRFGAKLVHTRGPMRRRAKLLQTRARRLPGQPALIQETARVGHYAPRLGRLRSRNVYFDSLYLILHYRRRLGVRNVIWLQNIKDTTVDRATSACLIVVTHNFGW